MLRLELVRVCENKWGTFGVLIYQGEPLWCTAELPWEDNQKNISCIPSGEYICESFWSRKHGHTFKVLNVSNRDGIVFHVGNRAKQDSKGCILLGSKFGVLDGQTAVLYSTHAFKRFMSRLSGEDRFELIIKDVTSE